MELSSTPVKTRVGEGEDKELVLVAAPTPKLRWHCSQGLGLRHAYQEATERHELEHCLATFKPAVLLLDLTLCQPGGTAEIPAIQRLSPSTKILALTNNPNEAEGMAALKAGVRGYCRQNISPTLLRQAVEMIQEGQVWIERSILPHLLEELLSSEEHRLQASSPAPDDHWAPRLTRCERNVAELIAQGVSSNREIAARLHVTEATVKAHLTAIFRKLDVTDRLQLGLYLARHNR